MSAKRPATTRENPGPARTGPRPGRQLPAAQGLKHLPTPDLERLTGAFRAWAAEPGRKADVRSRRRMLLIYLLLRYTGAKLGEVLGLDETRDIDAANGIVRLGAQAREVKLPADLAREIAAALADPLLAGHKGRLLRMDQGFVRRKFAERAKECGVAPDLANPSALRRSRAVELLSSGVPLPVVQGLLGHSSADLTASYLEASADDRKRIVERFIEDEARRKTSARNMFFGRVTAVRRGGLLAEVELETPAGLRVVSVVTRDSVSRLALEVGAPVTAAVKAPWVVISRAEGEPESSARNRFPGRVVRVDQDRVAAEVIVELADATHVCAVLTRRSVERLALRAGDRVWVLFKAFAVILNVD